MGRVKYTKKDLLLEIKKREKDLQERFYREFSPKAKDGFWKFCKHMDSDFFYDEKWVLMELAGVLQDVTNKVYDKVSISIFPRAGKSYIVTIWCAWMLIYNPKKGIMRNTGTDHLSKKFSKTLRSIVGEPEIGRPTSHHLKYLQVFPNAKLSKIDKSVQTWSLVGAKRETYFSGSPKTKTIMGSGCDLVGILDDPISNSADVNDSFLDLLWDWKIQTHDSRIEQGTPEVIISTRWDENDPTGMHIAIDGLVENGGKWKVFNYPALITTVENGMVVEKSICEEMGTTEFFLEKRKTFIQSGKENEWNAEYQQNPTAPKGRYFPKAELNYFKLNDLIGLVPNQTIAYLDPADEGIDDLALLIGQKIGLNVYIVDLIHSQDELNDKMYSRIVAKLIKNNVQVLVVEKNNGGKLVARNIRNKLRDMGSRCLVKTVHHQGRKLVRINSWVGQIKEFFYFRTDILAFPEYAQAMKRLWGLKKDGGGRQKDDMPDACAGMAEMIGVTSKTSGGSALSY